MIERLNEHYAFTNPASVYNEEALTALELVGRTTKKVNEVVDSQNQHMTDTINHLKEQDEDIKNQKENVIPATIKREVQNHIDNGQFDFAIDKYAGELEQRVDNLLGSYTTGATSSDAELIDMRVGADGVTYPTAGESVRKNMNRFFNMDVITATHKNLLSTSYKEKEYNGVDAYSQIAISPYFKLPAGGYCLIVPKSNTIGVMISVVSDSTRLLYKPNQNIEGKHYFNVPEIYEDEYLVLSFNCSYANPNTAGTYYAYYYLYQMDESTPIIPDYLLSKSNMRLLETDLVNAFHKNLYPYGNLYQSYNGNDVWSHVRSDEFTLDEGDYIMIVPDTNFIAVYIRELGNPDNRLISITDNIKNLHRFTVSNNNISKKWVIQGNASLSSPNTYGEYYLIKPYIFKDNGYPILPEYLTGKDSTVRNGYLMTTADTLTTGQMLTIDNTINVKKNKSLQFGANITTFSGVRIGHGKAAYNGNYIEINNSNIDVYSYSSSSNKIKSVAHGLTISDFIRVNINVKVGSADITIFTKSGMFTLSDVPWSGSNGLIFAESLSSSLHTVKLSWTTSDLSCPVWVFGDSYLGLTSPSRYPYYLLEMGYENWLASGYAGGSSSAELASFKTLLTMGKPKIVVWCLGMNNGDNGAINESWKTCVDEVMSLCNANNIELILATIPPTPTVDNNYKNEYVRDSGLRFVDFAGAVMDGDSWYDGMLSTDNVHPSESGAKALAMQILLDAPEIMG